MEPKFKSRRLCHSYFPPEYNEKSYLERTKRNHFWLGGHEGQMQLKNLRVGVAGLGGMGSNIAEILVRMGVGHIKIADPDTIELSNLNRQVIANGSTVGSKKADASANELRNITQDFELCVYKDGITKENAAEFVMDLDVLIDEIDPLPLHPHIWLHREARKQNLPIYSGFIIGLGTHIYKFHGEEFTIEDFLMPGLDNPDEADVNFVVNQVLSPGSKYFNKARKEAFLESLQAGDIPIFGASTYLSQSALVIRVIFDQLKSELQNDYQPTPIMPEFIKIDAFDFKFEIHRVI